VPFVQLGGVLAVRWQGGSSVRHPAPLEWQLADVEPANREVVVGLRDEQEALFRVVVEDGCAAGVFSTPYPKDTARAIVTMGWAVSSWFRPSGALSPEELGERYAQLALRLAGT